MNTIKGPYNPDQVNRIFSAEQMRDPVQPTTKPTFGGNIHRSLDQLHQGLIEMQKIGDKLAESLKPILQSTEAKDTSPTMPNIAPGTCELEHKIAELFMMVEQHSRTMIYLHARLAL